MIAMQMLFSGRAIPGSAWCEADDGDEFGRELFHRHYSYRPYADGRQPKLFVGPGYKRVLLLPNNDGLFVWRKFISGDGQQGINCAVFRNESRILSSDLIRDADNLAFGWWPDERHYTYVNPKKIRSMNPGCCFKRAGWRFCGLTKKGLHILELKPEWRVAA